jgi:hypothetical protein
MKLQREWCKEVDAPAGLQRRTPRTHALLQRSSSTENARTARQIH